jgi:adenylosuccinate lyase
MGRGDAHELVRKCAIKAYTENKDLLSVLMDEKSVSKLLSKDELKEVMNPKNYLGVSEKIVDNIVKKLTR